MTLVPPRIAVVGGGIMGMTLAYLLAKRGQAVDVFEASPEVGGLAGPITLRDGTEVDRFYHAILPSDAHLLDICADLGLADRLRFTETRTGVLLDGTIHPLNTPLDLLRFPPLPIVDRARLAWTVLAARAVRDWQTLERTPLEQWLVAHSGRRAYDTLWRPMFAAKFDGRAEGLRATYVWSRLVRTASTRQGATQKEGAGHLVGGYKALLDAMSRRVEAAGGRIRLRTPVEEVTIENGRATGVRVGGVPAPYDATVVTMQAPIARRLVPGAPASFLARLDAAEYLGIVCPLVVMSRPLTGMWTLNLADPGILFTGVIETTSYIDPALVGGHHLVYVPKYLAPGSEWLVRSDEDITSHWLAELERYVPGFSRVHVRDVLVHRERYVEPLHPVGRSDTVPPVETPVSGLLLATTAQIYPALTNGESVTRHAARVADVVTASTMRERRS